MKNYLKNLCFTISIVLQVLFLVSCGSGGSSNSSVNETSDLNNSSSSELTVKMISPSDIATAPLNTPIELQFSEAVKNVNTSTVTLYESNPTTGTQIAITTPIGGANNTYTFQATKYLSPSARYYVVVGTGIVSVSSNQSITATSFIFTTGNFAAPIATLINPTNGDTGVSTSTNIQIHFNESVSNVDTSTVLLHESDPTSKAISMSMSNIVESNTYTFTPVILKPDTKYYIEVTNEVRSIANGASINNTTFSFTTSKILKSPTVNILTPQNNAVVRSSQPDMIVQFSESVSGVNESTVILHESDPVGKSIAISMVKALPNNTYEFKPDVQLKTGMSYYLELTSNIVSESSGASLVPAIFNFSIGALSFGYITADGKSPVKICSVDSIGDFNNCHSSNWTTDYANSITFDPSHKYAYIIGKSSSVISVCLVDKNTGELTDCKVSTNIYNHPVNLIFSTDNSHVYITNNASNGTVLVCSINTPGDLPTNCIATGSGFDSPEGIAIDLTGRYVYVANNGNNSIEQCVVSTLSSVTDALENCVQYKNQLISKPTGLVMSPEGKHLYTASLSNIVSSPIDLTTGLLSTPSIIHNNFTKIIGLSLTSESNMYVADSGNGAVSRCKQKNEVGELEDCHFVALNNVGITGVAVLTN